MAQELAPANLSKPGERAGGRQTPPAPGPLSVPGVGTGVRDGGAGKGRAPGEGTERRITYLAWAKGRKRKKFRWGKIQQEIRNPPGAVPVAGGGGKGEGTGTGGCCAPSAGPGVRGGGGGQPRCPAGPRNPEVKKDRLLL